jgi:tight adherence protein C
MVEFLIAVLVFVAVVAIGSAILSGTAARRNPIRERLAAQPMTLGRPDKAGRGQKFLQLLGPIGAFVAGGGPSAKLKQQLTRAGYHDALAPQVYLGAKVLLLLLGMLGLVGLLFVLEFSVPRCILLGIPGGAILSFLPNAIVHFSYKARQSDIRNHLPDAVDLLEVCVSSGMGVETAWNLVGEEIRRVSKTLADEMALTNLEIHLGSPRILAMRHLAERTGVEDIGSMVAVMGQSERFGTSIADALRVFASSMREVRSMRAQELAEKMAVRLLIPMVCFIFPAMLLILVGPAIIRLLDAMANY